MFWWWDLIISIGMRLYKRKRWRWIKVKVSEWVINHQIDKHIEMLYLCTFTNVYKNKYIINIIIREDVEEISNYNYTKCMYIELIHHVIVIHLLLSVAVVEERKWIVGGGNYSVRENKRKLMKKLDMTLIGRVSKVSGIYSGEWESEREEDKINDSSSRMDKQRWSLWDFRE